MNCTRIGAPHLIFDSASIQQNATAREKKGKGKEAKRSEGKRRDEKRRHEKCAEGATLRERKRCGLWTCRRAGVARTDEERRGDEENVEEHEEEHYDDEDEDERGKRRKRGKAEIEGLDEEKGRHPRGRRAVTAVGIQISNGRIAPTSGAARLRIILIIRKSLGLCFRPFLVSPRARLLASLGARGSGARDHVKRKDRRIPFLGMGFPLRGSIPVAGVKPPAGGVSFSI
ncbi:hypothetical protein MPTK1_5g03170 [Marchantia polymorpha subsp. ruderalis]|uniref:Uncharacterized protein n=2 Tax=Marchantia polymorpha TaxID=3197 RepID=A0AAF6BEF4_MARPO|nr:hypothetical protein MARPO_0124s0006 [Marchantia polymorpha]BBN10388.1 hypothetical protein Mp_5g03170 [Marchantia polymorpha subsp. ruderalis]|eukprot:PTQ30429.1 hypothetical protein MARPO_0124s0006 [Marchantia polymorpha]